MPTFTPSAASRPTPWRLALVTLLQFREGLSGRQAAGAVRARIDWKCLLALDLADPGFDHSVLCEFRGRLLGGHAVERLLARVLDAAREGGLLKARGRQRTDSTHVLAAARELNRIELLAETLRAALNAITVAAPDRLRAVAHSDWHERYGRRVEDRRLPETGPKRDAYVVQVHRRLSTARRPGRPGRASRGAALPTVAVLRRVRARHFEQDENRPGRGVPPNVRLQSVEGRGPGDRIESPYDAEARYRSKSNMNWTGSMVHLTETCDAGAPHLLHADTTPGNVHAMRVEAIHAALATKGPVPSEHLVDSAYTSADHLIRAREQHGIDLVGPGRSPTGWQARTKGAFGTSDFAIDWEGEVARCPEGRTSTSWRGYHDKATGPYVRARFSAANCNPCPSKARCTRGRDQGRQLTLPAREQHEALAAARTRHKTEAGRALCAQRQGISVGASLNMYWTPAQLLTHHASNGCNLNPGDLLGTGTISAPTPGGYGSLLEITGGGKEPVRLPSGESRRFLENGDEVILRARARRNGCAPIGFGECRGIVLPAFSDFCPPLSKTSKTGKADHLLADSASERGHGHTAQRGPAKAAVAGPTATSSCAAM